MIGVITAIATILIVCLGLFFARLAYVNVMVRQLDVVPPRISLSIQVNGESVTDPELVLTPGTEIIPIVTVADDRDPSPKAVVNMSTFALIIDPNRAHTAVNGRVTPGVPIVLGHEGHYTLYASATDAAGNRGRSNGIGITVSKYPHYEATALTAACEMGHGVEGVTKLDVTILLAADQFDVRNIYLSHVSLWPVDETGRWLDDTGHGRMTIADAYAPGSREYDLARVKAEYFPAGYWRMEFSGGFLERPLPSIPSAFTLTGMGWTKDRQYFNFGTKPTAAEVSPDSLGTLEQLGLIKARTPTGRNE